jgi:GNAT superfamily N-acetyltransferase
MVTFAEREMAQDVLFADAALAARLEAAEAQSMVAWANAHAQLYPRLGARVERIAGGCAVYGGVGSPLNHALGWGMRGAVTRDDLDTLERFYRQSELPSEMYLCSLADLSLLKGLAERGYRPIEFLNVLVRPVQRDEPFPVARPPLVVQRAEGEGREVWARTVACGFGQGREPSDEDLRISRPMAYSADSAVFLAAIEGEAAGGGSITFHQSVASLHSDSTLPNYRCRGVQTAIIQARMAYAAGQGCDLAQAMTVPGGDSQRNYERLGFRIAYARLVLRLPQ